MAAKIQGLGVTALQRQEVAECIELGIRTADGLRHLRFREDCMTVDGDFTVDWGDGTVEVGVSQHDYASDGEFTVRISGRISEVQGYDGTALTDFWLPYYAASTPYTTHLSFNSTVSLTVGYNAAVCQGSQQVSEVVFGGNVVQVGSLSYTKNVLNSSPAKIRFLCRKCALGQGAFMFGNTGTSFEANVPDGAEDIPFRCFEGSKLASIRMPEGVKEIDARAFYQCPVLKKVYIPSTMERVYASAFPDSLTDIFLYRNSPPILNQSGTISGLVLHVPADSSGYESSKWADLSSSIVKDL